MSEWAAELSQYDEQFSNTEADGQPPDGSYDVTVTSAEIFSARDGTIYLNVKFQTDQNGIATKLVALNVPRERMQFTKRDLGSLGYEGKLSEVESMLSWLSGSKYKITVWRDKGYVKVSTDELVSKGEPVPAGAASTGDDSDIPF